MGGDLLGLLKVGGAETPGLRFRHAFSVVDAKDVHVFGILETGEQLGRDEEVLGTALRGGCRLDDEGMDHAFIGGVHALVDLVDDTEGALGEFLEGKQVEDGGD